MSIKRTSAVVSKNHYAAVAVPVAPPQSNPARGLRVSEAAAYLGVTIFFVRDAVWKNQLPAMKLGRRLIILKDDLDMFLETMKRECRA
jgi:excisionase family DNA binding protein